MSISRKAILSVALAVFLLAPVAAQTADAQVTIPVTQTLANGNTFVGNLAITSFRVVNGQLQAVGTLTGQIRDAAGTVLGTVATLITTPVTATGTCDILHLTLGPLHLDLLGLVVDLNQINLDITAQSGAGNLLGNLLCQVAGLLDNGGPAAGIANLLNQLLRILG